MFPGEGCTFTDGKMPVPSAGVFDNPLQQIVLNQKWASYVIGALEPLLCRDSWQGDIDFAIEQVERLLNHIAKAERPKTMPIGVFMPYAGVLPLSSELLTDGWRACNGDIVRISDYPDLYAVIGANFNTGGEDVDEFRLPNMKERVAVGVGDFAVGGAFNQPGQSGGEVAHVLTVPELPPHLHTINRSTSSGSGGQPGNAAGSTTGSPWSTNQTGGGAAHNNMQPYLVANYIIKAR